MQIAASEQPGTGGVGEQGAASARRKGGSDYDSY